MKWATDAYVTAKKHLAKPTIRTKGCRCVKMAIKMGLEMVCEAAFPLKLYVRDEPRKAVLASKVKGHLRVASGCIFKNDPEDETHCITRTGFLSNKFHERNGSL